ncbi:hypothetical protein F4774DRAFT_258182 [Daldinia eschscholtzii]|nr:hypothetical protein F4774DRAFT_258182 [Daldinia eschscholtzii]
MLLDQLPIVLTFYWLILDRTYLFSSHLFSSARTTTCIDILLAVGFCWFVKNKSAKFPDAVQTSVTSLSPFHFPPRTVTLDNSSPPWIRANWHPIAVPCTAD